MLQSLSNLRIEIQKVDKTIWLKFHWLMFNKRSKYNNLYNLNYLKLVQAGSIIYASRCCIYFYISIYFCNIGFWKKRAINWHNRGECVERFKLLNNCFLLAKQKLKILAKCVWQFGGCIILCKGLNFNIIYYDLSLDILFHIKGLIAAQFNGILRLCVAFQT